jgi:ribulose kinase
VFFYLVCDCSILFIYYKAHADVTGCVLEIPEEPEAVLLGAAVLGGRAGGAFENLPAAMAAMNR